MANLSSFYPQPVIAGTTDGTFAEGDDARIVGAIQSGGAAGGGLSGTYPNPTLAPVAIPYTTNTRAISDRFTDKYVNVLDFGADPTGAEDSALAIQRAIKYANGGEGAGALPKEDVISLTYDDVADNLGQIDVPLLFARGAGPAANNKTVFFPVGNYKINRPIVIYNNVCLEGSDSSQGANLIVDPSGDYNAIEELGVWSFREQASKDVTVFSCTGDASTNIVTAVGHNFKLNQGVFFFNKTGGSGITEQTKYFVRDVVGDTFKIASTFGGAAISIGSEITEASVAEHNIWKTFVDIGSYIAGASIRNLTIQPTFPARNIVSSDSNLNTINAGFAYSNGSRVILDQLVGGSPLATSTEYYVVRSEGVTGNNFQLATEPNGSPINFSTITSGRFAEGVHPRNNLETYSWYYAPYGGSNFTTCTGTAGDSVVTMSQDCLPKIGSKIRFRNLPTIHTVVSSNVTTITIDPPLPTTLTPVNHLLFGIKAQSGIMVPAGENVIIDRCFVSNLAGNGIHITGGSPSPIISGCMCSHTDVGFRIDVSPFTLVQPSGDGPNVFLECRAGTYYGNVIGIKYEELRARRLVVEYWPYTTNEFRTVLDLSAAGGGAGNNTINMIGGSINLAGPISSPLGMHDDFKTNQRAIIERLEAGVSGCVNWFGTNIRSALPIFMRTRQARTGALISSRSVNNGFDGYTTFSHLGGFPAFFDSTRPEFEVPLFPSNTRFLARENTAVGSVKMYDGSGIMLDKGISLRVDPSNFTRSGTVATITCRNAENNADANHNLNVGDWIQIYQYTEKTPSDSANLAVLNTTNSITAGLVSFRVVTITNSSTFTIEVADNPSAATSGVLFFKSYKLGRMHTIENNCHRFDLPSTAGDPNNEFRAFSVFDSENNQLAGLRSSQIDDSRWWTKGEIGLGGTIGTPASRILHGTGAPSVSAPNGSLYLRTDGDASTTLYVRAGGTWKPLSSYEA